MLPSVNEKTFVIALIAIAFCFAVNETRGQRYIKLGATLSHMTGQLPDAAVQGNGMGIVAGLAFTKHLARPNLYVQPEILFIQKGDKIKTSDNVMKLTTNYLEVPVLFRASLADPDADINLFFEAGPSVGLCIGGKYEVKTTLTNGPGPYSGLIKFGDPPSTSTNNVYFDNRVDIGLNAGVAVVFGNAVMFDFRYGYGITSVIDAPKNVPQGTSRSDFRSRNRGIQLSLNIVFSKGKDSAVRPEPRTF